jgi:hypothetical protein
MYEATRRQAKSREAAVVLYDTWVRDRQRRKEFIVLGPDDDFEKIGLKNFNTQNTEPRRHHLKQLKEFGKELTTADKVALLAKLELSPIEVSALLHRMSIQVVGDPEAVYFSKENLADNCGCGCGSCCSSLMRLSYEERINVHRQLKPFSVDPFNEAEIPEDERDALLISDFLDSYEALSRDVTSVVDERYYDIGTRFGGQLAARSPDIGKR